MVRHVGWPTNGSLRVCLAEVVHIVVYRFTLAMAMAMAMATAMGVWLLGFVAVGPLCGGLLVWILARYAGHTVYAVLVDLEWFPWVPIPNRATSGCHFPFCSSGMLGIGQAKCSYACERRRAKTAGKLEESQQRTWPAPATDGHPTHRKPQPVQVQTPDTMPMSYGFLASVLPTERAPLSSATPLQQHPGMDAQQFATDRPRTLRVSRSLTDPQLWVYRLWQRIQNQQHWEAQRESRWRVALDEDRFKFQCNGE